MLLFVLLLSLSLSFLLPGESLFLQQTPSFNALCELHGLEPNPVKTDFKNQIWRGDGAFFSKQGSTERNGLFSGKK